MEGFKSRRLVIALLGVAVLVIGTLIPDIRPHLDEIIEPLVQIIGILIGGYTIEHVAENYARAKGAQAAK